MNRLVGKDNEFEVIIFGDKVILDEDVENWPVCDFLISFFSEGFPLDKAIAYARLRRNFLVLRSARQSHPEYNMYRTGTLLTARLAIAHLEQSTETATALDIL